MMGLVLATGCARPNPSFSREPTDGQLSSDVMGGSDDTVADRPDPAAPDTGEATDLKLAPDQEAAEAGPDLPLTTAPTLLVGSASARAWHGGPSGVEFLVDHCPAGQVVIGHRGADSDETTFVARLQIQCGSLRVTRSQPPFTVEVTPGALLPARGKINSGPAWSAPCPPNQVVVRYAGQEGLYIESLRTTCAQLEVSADRSGIRFVAHEDLPAHGTGPSPAFEENCEALGQVAVGADTRAGGWLDAIRPVCAPITVVP
jgi:hypothetical protein